MNRFLKILLFFIIFFLSFFVFASAPKVSAAICEGPCTQSTCGSGKICVTAVGSTIGECVDINSSENTCPSTPGTSGPGTSTPDPGTTNPGTTNPGTIVGCVEPNGQCTEDSTCCDRNNEGYDCFFDTITLIGICQKRSDLPDNSGWSEKPGGEPVTSKSSLKSMPIGCEKTGSDDNPSFSCNTGLGVKINANTKDFTMTVFSVLLSISGAIAVLLIIISGYRLMTSFGNPEKVKGAKEQLTSALIGLLFIIFSVVILQIIGVDILKIPGFF